MDRPMPQSKFENHLEHRTINCVLAIVWLCSALSTSVRVARSFRPREATLTAWSTKKQRCVPLCGQGPV